MKKTHINTVVVASGSVVNSEIAGIDVMLKDCLLCVSPVHVVSIIRSQIYFVGCPTVDSIFRSSDSQSIRPNMFISSNNRNPKRRVDPSGLLGSVSKEDLVFIELCVFVLIQWTDFTEDL